MLKYSLAETDAEVAMILPIMTGIVCFSSPERR
jgi:hypothetical protein